MNRINITFKVLALSFFMAGSMFAQQKLTKVSQAIKVNKNVTIDLNTSYCNIVFDTWNKDVVEIEAYIEGEDLDEKDMQDVLKTWNVDVDATANEIAIRTKDKGNFSHVWVYDHEGDDGYATHAILEELKLELADIPDLDIDVEIPDVPEIPEIPEIPELPELPELPEGVHKMHFDYEAYKKDGEKYLKEWAKSFEANFGKDYAKKMEVWGEKFGEEWGDNYKERMKEWRARHAEKMERKREHMVVIRQSHEKAREAHMKAREKHMKAREKLAKSRRVVIEKMIDGKTESKVKKTIVIKMPKNAKLKVNVRHGELQFAANIDNLKANLSHTKFTAHSINGSATSINASFSPVYVSQWNLGNLNLNYVEQVELDDVKHLVLTANASNVTIGKIMGNTTINENIGDLKILNVDEAFTNLNVILQNTDAYIALPKTGHSLQYSGERSRFNHPQKNEKENTTTFSTGNMESGKSIVVNAKFSNVTME
ncbi:hypothetical protein [Snuella lapsa]|uniref:Adhesin domain-containing protein n=1 Tax=Snuella lapsa TaxID=870481 RepID=A0ABP6YNF8_9FLAO